MGRALVARVIEAARGRFDTLRLRTSNPEAARLYAALGFARSAKPGDATHLVALARAPRSPAGT